MTSVKQTRDGAVGLLTLGDPASLNAMTPELLGGLAVAIGEMTGDPGVRALVTPGHSPGHIVLLHEPTRTLLVGDALFNPS